MTTRANLQRALQIVREGRCSRARANDFGWSEAQFREQSRLWNWALSVLVRKSCGAKRRRDGKPCRAMNVPGSARCKWHGGCSTGPRSVAGRAKSLANLRQFRVKGGLV